MRTKLYLCALLSNRFSVAYNDGLVEFLIAMSTAFCPPSLSARANVRAWSHARGMKAMAAPGIQLQLQLHFKVTGSPAVLSTAVRGHTQG